MALWNRTREPDPDHPEPVEIDLGIYPDWKVQAVIAGLVDDGYRMQPLSMSQTGNEGGHRRHKLIVHADDADAVRQVLVEAELL